MRRLAFVTVCLVISSVVGVGRSGQSIAADHRPGDADRQTTLRRVTDQDEQAQPLLPQPGNIWTGVLPTPQQVPAANGVVAPGVRRRDDRPVAAAANADQGRDRPAVPVATPAAGRRGAVAATAAAGRRGAVAAATAAAPAPTGAGAVRHAVRVRVGDRSSAGTSGTTTPVPTGIGTDGGPMVQLVAAASADRAVAAWRRLREADPGLTSGHSPAISAAEVNGHQVWRLRAGGFADLAAAAAFCSDMRAAKADCWVIAAPSMP